jgi:PIN domain nuclease of toxin-antitoxin system
MNLLLDSHTFLWFVWDDPQLSVAAKQLIQDPANHKFVSVASCWEIAIKCGVGKLKLGEPSQSYLNREITANNFDLLQISLDHATAVETLPQHHRDPFDRILVVQAKAEGLSIVSSDAGLDAYGVTRLW